MNLRQNKYVRRLAEAKRVLFPGKPAATQAAAQKQEEEPVCITRVTPAKTVADLKPEYCTGCGACSNVCPTQAITMEFDREGFLAPVVHEDKCVNCGLCARQCPVMNPQYPNWDKPVCYAAMGSDEVRAKSSSGGIFSLVSSYVLANGGYVCGAAFDENFVLKHTIVSSEEDMPKLRESKYVQSDTNTAYTQIGELLKQQKLVLFSGCGCQVAGLYAYLDGKKIDTDNLYTLDLMCHGSPSPKLFEKYLKEEHAGHEIAHVSFREKAHFGWTAGMTVQYKDGGVYRKSKVTDPYYKAFQPFVSLRKSCGHCLFAKIPRQGDLTLADFWGAGALKRNFDDQKGTSIVSVNSEKGKKLLEIIRKDLKLLERVDTEYILTHGQPYNHSFKTNPAHRRYFDMINMGASLDKAFEYATKAKFDVGIMGVWFGCNYGSIATYYALHEIIRSFGLSVLMIDKPLVYPNDPELGYTHSRRFAEEHYEISRRRNLRDHHQLNAHVDAFVLGSDQVWNRGINRSFGMAYYFDFADATKKKITYAASFGHAADFSGITERATISEYMSRFDGIGVREADGVKICKDVYGVDAVQVLDPVFVADREIFDELTEKAAANNRPDKDEKYICTYILDYSDEKKEAVKWISQQLGIKVINLLDGIPWDFAKNKQAAMGMGEIPENVQVEDWLYYIKNCEYLITDSCHGMSFAIVFGRPFVGIGNKGRGLSRFESLVNLFHLNHRFVTDASEIVGNPAFLEPVDYEPVYEILEKERVRSRTWLRDVLFSPKKVDSHCAFPCYDSRMEVR